MTGAKQGGANPIGWPRNLTHHKPTTLKTYLMKYGATGLAMGGGGIEPLARPPAPPKRAQLIGPPKSHRD